MLSIGSGFGSERFNGRFPGCSEELLMALGVVYDPSWLFRFFPFCTDSRPCELWVGAVIAAWL
jgi:hypothetical protein